MDASHECPKLSARNQTRSIEFIALGMFAVAVVDRTLGEHEHSTQIQWIEVGFEIILLSLHSIGSPHTNAIVYLFVYYRNQTFSLEKP